ncbi:MAG: hypothetical protein ACREIQ_03160 [Nitrospiria bacterium]
MTSKQDWLTEVKNSLGQRGISPRGSDAGDGSIDFTWEDGYALHLGTDGILTCSFKVDLEEIRMLVSGDTTEDLSEDELCRVAREELRPRVDRYRRRFIQIGFEEGVESDGNQYAIVFTKPLMGTTPQEAGDVLKWCQETLGAVTK